jgi:hypothetical protein|tara:strand:+ start:2172 stop:2420 length:249 start_codon:yes stop_codon:yes gene_type:complete
MLDKIQSAYKEKILKKLEGVSGEMLPVFYKITHILATGLIPKKRRAKKLGSLRGIWKGCQIDDELFFESRRFFRSNYECTLF